MLEFHDRGSWCYVDGPEGERKILYNRLVVLIRNATLGAVSVVKRPLYQPKKQRFPAGLIFMALKKLKGDVEVKIIDEMTPPCEVSPLPKAFSMLNSYQHKCNEKIFQKKRGIWQIATAGGKCLGVGTPVLLYDGRVIPVEKVRRGDKLMGPDSLPRKVLSLTRGHGPLFRIEPIKGEPWICNDVHILTLVHTETGEIVDIPLNEYLKQHKTFKHTHKLFRPSEGVDFPKSLPLTVSPYFLGVWVGDGSKLLNDVSVTKPDIEIENACRDEAKRWGCAVRVYTPDNRCKYYRIVRESNKVKSNPLLDELRKLFSGGVRIPHHYLTASYEDRLSLLAGLLDTDGSLNRDGVCLEFTTRYEGLAHDVEHLCRSVGLWAMFKPKIVNGVEYYRALIAGKTTIIPLRIPRKRPNKRKMNKDALRTGFKTAAIGEGEYVGFTLDGDGRFLLGDFTVTHNTLAAIALASRLNCKILFLVDEKQLLHQTKQEWLKFHKERPGQIGDGVFAPRRFTVALIQTLYKRRNQKEVRKFLDSIDLLIIDECHGSGARGMYSIAMRCENAYWRVGMSATPVGRTDQMDALVIGATGPIVVRRTITDLAYTTGPERRLAKPMAIFWKYPKQERVEGEWHEVYRDGVAKNDHRNKAILYLCRLAEKPTLLFYHDMINKHGERLLKLCEAIGLSAVLVGGSSSIEERAEAVAKANSGDVDILIASSIFNKGVNIPNIRSAVNAAGFKSFIQTMQKLGRGLRYVEGKDRFVLWELWDRHAVALNRHCRERKTIYEENSIEVVRFDALKDCVAWSKQVREPAPWKGRK